MPINLIIASLIILRADPKKIVAEKLKILKNLQKSK